MKYDAGVEEVVVDGLLVFASLIISPDFIFSSSCH
jgi:hypothetical protein